MLTCMHSSVVLACPKGALKSLVPIHWWVQVTWVRSAYDGEDEPGTCCEVWPEPLVLSGRLGLKLSDGGVIFRADITQDPMTAAIGAQGCSQPQSSRAEASLCFHLQHAVKIDSSGRRTTAAVGSQWWLQSSAACAGASGQQCHSQLARQTVSCAGRALLRRKSSATLQLS